MKQIQIVQNLDPGDVVLLDFPGAQKTKRRPALILSSRAYHRERPDIILGPHNHTGKFRHVTVGPPFARLGARETDTTIGVPSVLRHAAAVSSQARIGKLSSRDWAKVIEKIQLSLGLRQGH